jgi:hypothetical protein
LHCGDYQQFGDLEIFLDDREIDVDSSTKFQRFGSGSLMVNNLELADSGRYTCVALNALGNATAAAFLSVEGILLNTVGSVERATVKMPKIRVKYLETWWRK